MNQQAAMEAPRSIRLNPSDNVAIVVNSGGLPTGTQLGDITLIDHVPQAHKVTLEDIPEGGAITRYGEVIGYAIKGLPPARCDEAADEVSASGSASPPACRCRSAARPSTASAPRA